MLNPCRIFGYLRSSAAGQKNAAEFPNMSRLFLIVLMASVGAMSAAAAQPTGRDIVKKMHDRYAGKWYPSFTFGQTTYTIFDSLHFDLSKGHEDGWKGKPVYVIGADKGEDSGKLAQVETYHDYKTGVSLEDRIFDPGKLGRSH
jgi:hypothetical protein